MNDDELLDDFVAESREHLDTIEPDLLEMERAGAEASQEVLNRVFRAIHSIKGAAGFFALDALKKVSHMTENVLMPIRDGMLTPTSEVMDALLAAVDKLRVMIDDVQASEDVPCEDELTNLEALLNNAQSELDGAENELDKLEAVLDASDDKPTDQAPVDETPIAQPSTDSSLMAEFDPASPSVVSAVKRGMHVYRVTANFQDDLHARGLDLDAFTGSISKVGEILIMPANIGQLNDATPAHVAFSFIFASVLEADLVPDGLELPAERVEQVDCAMVEQAQAASPDTPTAQTASKPKAKASPNAEGTETLRVKVDLLTSLMNTASELVLGRNQLLSALEAHRDQIPGLPAILQNVDHVTSELQEGVMQTRMQPVGAVFGRFTRVVRDMAKKLGKEIQLQTEGADVELDKSVIELLGDPLTHIIRNCADHALETPDEREAAGKSRAGTIQLHAYHEGGQVNIAIADDGRGIDAAKVSAKAVDKGVITAAQAAKMSEEEIVRLVFAPGFSTAEQVTDVSGRGVGMDVVRTNIEKLGGHIDIETKVGQGTTVVLLLPLTLAIVPALIVGVEDLRFAVPQVNLVELVCVRSEDIAERIESVHGADVLRLRGRLLPLVGLADVLGIEHRPPVTPPGDEKHQSEYDRRTDRNILVLQIGPNRFGLIVDGLFDSEEIVVKPLSSFVKQCVCFSGATIMGDGKVLMILDVGGLAKRANLRFASLADEEKRRQEKQIARTAARRRSVILFNAADHESFAVPQDKVLRLERVRDDDIEQMGGNEFIQYRGKGLPLVRLDRHLPVNPVSVSTNELFLVIPKHRDASGAVEARAGIVASRIVDAMDVDITMQKANLTGPGVQGSAIVDEHLTLFFDPVELIDGICNLQEEAV